MNVGADKAANIYNASTGILVNTLDNAHTLGLNDCYWVDNNTLITASDDKSIKVWDITTGQVLNTLEGNVSFVYSLSINPINKLVLSGGYDGSVRLFDIISNKCVIAYSAHSEPVSSVDFCCNGNEYATGSHDGLIRIWDSSYFAVCKKTVHSDSCPPVACVKYSNNGNYLLVSTLDSHHRLYSNTLSKNEPNQCIKTFCGHTNKKFSMFSTIYERSSSLGPLIISGSEDKNVHIWNITKDKDNNKPIKLHGHEDVVLSVATNPAIDQIASSTSESIRIWNSC